MRARSAFGVLLAAVLGLMIAVPARAVTIDEFGLGIAVGAAPAHLAAGPDGNVWFTELNRRAIGRITPAGAITEFSPLNISFETADIAAGPDGNVWFTEAGALVGRITPGGSVAEYPTLHSTDTTLAIAGGPDGNVWFTEAGNRIGRITPSAAVTEFPVPTAGAGLTSIAAGPDGNLWFTEYQANRIGRITPSGQITEFSAGISPDSGPVGIGAGPDGNLWFVEQRRGRLARITPGGTVTELPAGSGSTVATGAVATARDGRLWFTGQNAVARRDAGDTLRGFTAGVSAGAGLADIAAGPDGNLWFTELAGNRIGRVRLDPPSAVTAGASATTATATTLSGVVDPMAEPTSVVFEYGPTSSYGATIGPVSAGDGIGTVPISARATGLVPGTAYHFRVLAASPVGIAYGGDLTFTTSVTAPVSAAPPTPGDADRDGVTDDHDRCPLTPRGAFDRDGDGCAGPYRRITSTPTGSWTVLNAGVRIASMHLPSLPRGARVKLTCRSCHVKQTLTAKHRTLTLKRLRNKLLRRHRGFTVTVTRRGYIGERVTLTVKRYGHGHKDLSRAAARPFKTTRRCIPIGSAKPAKRCSATPAIGP